MPINISVDVYHDQMAEYTVINLTIVAHRGVFYFHSFLFLVFNGVTNHLIKKYRFHKHFSKRTIK